MTFIKLHLHVENIVIKYFRAVGFDMAHIDCIISFVFKRTNKWNMSISYNMIRFNTFRPPFDPHLTLIHSDGNFIIFTFYNSNWPFCYYIILENDASECGLSLPLVK